MRTHGITIAEESKEDCHEGGVKGDVGGSVLGRLNRSDLSEESLKEIATKILAKAIEDTFREIEIQQAKVMWNWFCEKGPEYIHAIENAIRNNRPEDLERMRKGLRQSGRILGYSEAARGPCWLLIYNII